MTRKTKHVTLIILLLLVAALAIAGCGGKAKQNVSTPSSDKSGSIKIGMTAAITGPYSEFGEAMRRAAIIAVDEWNAKGGINGRNVELVALDDQLDPNKAAINAKKLIEEEKVVAIIGPAGSGPMFAVIPLAQAKNIPHINVVAQTVQIAYPDGTDKPPRLNLFSTAIQNDVEAIGLAKFSGSHWKKVGLICESTTYGKSGIDLIASQLEKEFGIQPVGKEQYDQKDPDMTAQLARLQKAGAEVVVIVGLGSDSATIRKNMNRLSFNVPLLGAAGMVSAPYKEIAGDLVAGSYASLIASYADPDKISPKAKQFADAWLAKWGNDRWYGSEKLPQISFGWQAAYYDGAALLLEAINRAKSTDSNEIIKQLNNLKDFDGVVKKYSFSPQQHHAIMPEDLGIYIYEKQNDKIIMKKAI